MVVVSGKLIAQTDLDASTTTYVYEQVNQVPTYNIAIAAGSLEYRNLNTRTGLWAEKTLIDQASEIFKETETFIKTVSIPYNSIFS